VSDSDKPAVLALVSLSDARPAVASALRHLLETPEATRPFVVIEEADGERFVQFAGSKERGLLFDVPALGIAVSPVPGNEPALAALVALDTLQLQLGVAPDALVNVCFDFSGEPTLSGAPSTRRTV